MVRPPLLAPGDRIGLLAPAKRIAAKSLAEAKTVLESWGLEVVMGANTGSEKHPYLNGTDEERRSDLQHFLDAGDIKAILCARGGYGSSRIVDSLDLTLQSRFPKWVVGFSDITAIHHLLFTAGFMSIHGIMPIYFANPAYTSSIAALKELLFKGTCQLEAPAHSMNIEGIAEGRLIGGNLSLLIDSLGTPTEVDTTGRILIIEEIDEPAYRIDRMLNHLKRSKKLQSLAGVAVGHLTDIRESPTDFGETAVEIIHNYIAAYQIPLAFSFPTGHEAPNMPWIHGAEVELRVNSTSASITFH